MSAASASFYTALQRSNTWVEITTRIDRVRWAAISEKLKALLAIAGKVQLGGKESQMKTSLAPSGKRN